jgi:hypothetical protein
MPFTVRTAQADGARAFFSGDFAGTRGKFLQKSPCMGDERAYNPLIVWHQRRRWILLYEIRAARCEDAGVAQW